MGCFLGCFGFSKKLKTRKGSAKIISIHKSYGRYVPLDSDVSIKLDSDEKPEGSATKFSERLKETSSVKTKKKVSFNLNVKAYEPLPSNDENEIDTYLSEGEEKTMWEYNQEERPETHPTILRYEEDSIALRTALYPSNYRYQNWRETCDEDEMKVDESDLDEDDDDDLEWDDDDDIDSEDEYDKPQQNPKISVAEYDQERKCNLQASLHEELSRIENGRKRNERFSCVLNPVENLSQWKAVKSKQSKNQKENISSSEQQQQRQIPLIMHKSSHPLTSITVQTMNKEKLIMHEIAVNASLSNWLV